MKLVYKETGVEVKVGDKVEGMYVRSFPWPHSPSSSGTVYVNKYAEGFDLHSQGYYVSAFGMEWIEREDRHEDVEGRELTPVEKQELAERLKPLPKAPDNILAVWTFLEKGGVYGWIVLAKGEDQSLWRAEPAKDQEPDCPPDYYLDPEYRWTKFADYDSHKDVAGAWSPHWF